MENKLVSVILPTYGRPQYITEAVQSIINQDYSNIEVIIIDDNGLGTEQQKETSSILSFIEDPRIKYFANPKNIGGAESRNLGVSKASGELITFLDDDDTYELNKVSVQVNSFQNGDVDISLCGMTVYVQDLGESIKDCESCQPRGDSISEFLLYGCALTPMIMLKRSCFDSVGGFDDVKKFQDHILMLKLLSLKPKIIIVKERLFTHRAHSNERISTSKNVIDAYYHRFNLENTLAKELSQTELITLSLHQNLLLLPVFIKRKEIGKSVKCFFRSLCLIKNPSNLNKLIKVFIPYSLKIYLKTRFYSAW